ncbi:MAG TPA: hypothetical protein VJC16_00335 [Candidatus Nanoarchaeia archaeon]|nr:hypothetical protein [Candidatus Nanoarchaeia archaeon]
MATIARDSPLTEITLRRYEKPYELSGRGLVKKLCLSLGLLQPGDSRDIIVDVLAALLSKRHEKSVLSAEDVKRFAIEYRKLHGLPLAGIASSNVRRQLLRLRALMLVEKQSNSYRITEFNTLHDAFTEKVERFLLPSIVGRVKEYLQEADKHFPAHPPQQSH